MKKNPKVIGDTHVKSVCKALRMYISGEDIKCFTKTVIQTVHFIANLYPDITEITSKFDMDRPDQFKDLTLHSSNGDEVSINLFLIKKNGKIQPKNPGAKSLFSKYFLSDSLQDMFNIEFEKKYKEYLRNLTELRLGRNYVNSTTEMRKIVSSHFPKFIEEINSYREKFLYNLRELSFNILKDFYNDENRGFFHAYNVFFMIDDINIITSYGTNDYVNVEKFSPGIPNFSEIGLYKSGKNTLGIQFGEVALTLRFKFESGPSSSIKIAASYDKFPNEAKKEQINDNTVKKMVDLFRNHTHFSVKNSSNAIGKCHEAITYFYFIKKYPSVSQVEPDSCIQLLSKYYSLVDPKVLKKLYESTATLVPEVTKKLYEKYNNFTIESIELVPESYIQNRLDTGDLRLILLINGKYIIENISLKALKKKGNKVTTKNPGIGTILGPSYFNIGTLESSVKEVKSRFENEEVDHRQSLEILAEELGMKLGTATQEQLKNGIKNLLGQAMMVITFYEDNISFCKEYSQINSDVSVLRKTPSSIQNTLTWNNDVEELSLRVKFSRGKEYGWSTIKLTSEYQVK